jgi:pimeloyl-ACP methyl ester carboxylesterase
VTEQAARPLLLRRALRLAAAGLVLALVLAGVALLTMDRWLFVILDPGAFDAESTPAAPDYRDDAAWAALPEREDGADVAVPEAPAIDQRTAPVAVFYLHPTTALGRDWNAAIDEPAIVEATERGGISIQASAFNACCAVYAPRYRQANGRAFTEPDADGEQAIAVALADVDAAFTEFLARTGERPFVLAGHSQGAILGARLIRERIAGTALAERLVAAYLIGAPLAADGVGVPVCASPTATGCFVSWHARGPEYRPNAFEFNHAAGDPMAGRVCVNPVSWTLDGEFVAAERHGGALFFDTDAPAILPAFASTRCVGGTLVVDDLELPDRGVMDALLLWTMGPGNYHPIEIQLFYTDLRRNAVDRVAAFMAKVQR